MTLRIQLLLNAGPGQFVHISPEAVRRSGYHTLENGGASPGDDWALETRLPILRRAFSIAGFRRSDGGVEIDVIYRVVGTATRWMKSLAEGDPVSVLGPLGNTFPVSRDKRIAWLIAGGVGLPPMLWLASALTAGDRQSIAFCGAQSADLLALTMDQSVPPAEDAGEARLCAAEFARHEVPAVISTDDGSIGFHGHVGAALATYDKANPTRPDDVVAYTCGPEPLVRFVADYCTTRGIECYVCMERSMACGTGTCQSCVIPIRDDSDAQGWRYKLCCTDGPVFDARSIVWEPAE